MRNLLGLPAFLLVNFFAGAAIGQVPARVAAGTPLWITSKRSVPLRVGQEIEGELVYRIFGDNREVIPAGTLVEGAITGLEPDRQRRIEAKLRGDFTPFSRPIVTFREARLSNGVSFPLAVEPGRNGAKVLRLAPPAPRKGGLIRSEFHMGVAMVKDRIRTVTGPGKADRLKALLYRQLPYHPQQVDAGTGWAVEATADIPVPAIPPKANTAAPARPAAVTPVAEQGESAKTYTVQAYITKTVSSADGKVGEPFQAAVAEPVRDEKTGEVIIPQGTKLNGELTKVRAARRFGRSGQLQTNLNQMSMPGSSTEQVQTTIESLDATGGSDLAMDREGRVQRKPQDKVVVPLLLVALAGRPLDRDRGDNAFGKDAVASNSLGVIGFIVGTAGGWRNVAAGIGYYGAALAVWNRWIKRGTDITLQKDTRMVVQATARRSAPMGGGVR